MASEPGGATLRAPARLETEEASLHQEAPR
jgi:hypothetical protein